MSRLSRPVWYSSPLLLLLAMLAQASPATDKVIANIKVPAGFRFSVYADNVPDARSMAMGQRGTLFVGTNSGSVYAIGPAGPVNSDKSKPTGTGKTGTGRTDNQVGDQRRTVRVLANKLNMPNGVAFKDGALYVAEIHRVIRYDNIESSLDKVPEPKVVRDDFPKDRHHGARYIAFGPDGKLYLGIGAPCNVCNEPKYAAISRMNPDGSDLEVFARGVRNTVGFTWHPTTRELWFSDNGRDYLGDDNPPCELNRAPHAGMDFGFPYCHGRDARDPDFGNLGDCSKMTPPVQLLGAHVAPLAVKFYTAHSFPAAYHGQIFIAEHGSWNRSQKSGYRITAVTLQGNKAVAYQPFVTGFNRGDQVFGRPVDLLVLEDGSLLVSDDQAGAVYRISYATS